MLTDRGDTDDTEPLDDDGVRPADLFFLFAGRHEDRIQPEKKCASLFPQEMLQRNADSPSRTAKCVIYGPLFTHHVFFLLLSENSSFCDPKTLL